MLHLRKHLKIFIFSFLLLGLNLPSNSQVPTAISQNSERTFFCGISQGLPATILKSPDYGFVPIIVYESEYFSSLGYDPITRCETISDRFQRLYAADSLKYFTIGKVEGMPVICGIRNKAEICSANNLLIILHPNITKEEQQQILSNLFDVSAGVSSNILSSIIAGVSDNPLSDISFGFDLYGDPTTPPPFPKPITSPPQEPIDPPPKK